MRIALNEIIAPDAGLAAQLQTKLDGKTKPPGSLGRLEQLAMQLGLIQGSLSPALRHPHLLVCAGDHGALGDPRGRVLSAYPQEVTWQMVENFLAGGAAINVFARVAGLSLVIADAGVAHDFGVRAGLIDAKIAAGTASWFDGPAMTGEQCAAAMQNGVELVRQLQREGCNAIGFGEMGIGNSGSAALLTHFISAAPLDQCVGRGTGLDDNGLALKRSTLQRLAADFRWDRDPATLLAQFGGFEIAMMSGAMLAAAQARMVLLIDGFIVSAALLIAHAIAPAVLHYCVFSHRSQECGHAVALDHLRASPLLDLDLRLGEGTGAALAWPLLRAAAAMINEMASFEQAGVATRDQA